MKEKLLVHTPVFDLVEREIEGVPFKPVALKAHDWVTVIIIDKKTREGVFVRQTRWGENAQTTEFPCGTVDDVDSGKEFTAAQVCAARELKEETGIEAEPGDFEEIATFNPNPAYFDNRMHVMYLPVESLAEKFSRRGEQKLDENEDCAPFLAKLDDMEKFIEHQAMGVAALYYLHKKL